MKLRRTDNNSDDGTCIPHCYYYNLLCDHLWEKGPFGANSTIKIQCNRHGGHTKGDSHPNIGYIPWVV